MLDEKENRIVQVVQDELDKINDFNPWEGYDVYHELEFIRDEIKEILEEK